MKETQAERMLLTKEKTMRQLNDYLLVPTHNYVSAYTSETHEETTLVGGEMYELLKVLDDNVLMLGVLNSDTHDGATTLFVEDCSDFRLVLAPEFTTEKLLKLLSGEVDY